MKFLEETPDLFSTVNSPSNSRPSTKLNFQYENSEENKITYFLQRLFKATFVRLSNEYEKIRFSWAFKERLRYTNPFDHKIFLLYEEGIKSGGNEQKNSFKEGEDDCDSNLVGMIELSFQPIFGKQVPSRLTTTSYLKKVIFSKFGFQICPYISNLLIKQNARQKGYGTALVLQCEEYAKNLVKQYHDAAPGSIMKIKNYVYASNEQQKRNNDKKIESDRDQSASTIDVNIYLHAEANYLPAQKLYKRLNYSQVGKGIKFGAEVIKFEKQLKSI